MNELRRRLQQGDPIAREPELVDVDVERMRRVVLAAGRTATSRVSSFSLVLVASLAFAVVGGLVLTGTQGPSPQHERTMTSATTPADPADPILTRRQLQFATPGGTRVIWTFNADFELR